MLNVVCPACQRGMKLKAPRTGKFSPTCRHCKTKFKLLIKQQADGTFRYRALLQDESGLSISHKTAQESTVKLALQRQPLQVPSAGDAAASIDEAILSRKPAKPAKPGRLGPYRLIKLLDESEMGSVYLARQTRLDRNVALKVVQQDLTPNPSVLARFTREAYAASRLVHPHIVQMYEMGNDNGFSYFSMELVGGRSLFELVGEGERLDPQRASSYILHAARGLACAHKAGIVHRDVKPSNVMLTECGLVKIADLGLAKIPDSERLQRDVAKDLLAASAAESITQVGTTVGTPWYMSPEQASSLEVDHRTDIYSLGCTFYVLLTGQRPFEGESLEEVVFKHCNVPLVSPAAVVESVPHELSAIVVKMMAKRTEDRFQSMEMLIVELEKFLGVGSAEMFTPDEQEAVQLRSAAANFNRVSRVKVRDTLPVLGSAVCILLGLVTWFLDWRIASSFLILPLVTSACCFVVTGLKGESVLFATLRELVFRSGIFAAIKWGLACLLLIFAAVLLGTVFHWIVAAAVGVVIGLGYRWLIEMPLSRARQNVVKEVKTLIRKMRQRGLDEATIQMFVATCGSNRWEEFFENLFGYRAKREIRAELVRLKPEIQNEKFGAWRDGVYDCLMSQLQQIRESDDRTHLQQIEQAGLEFEGVAIAEAKSKARENSLTIQAAAAGGNAGRSPISQWRWRFGKWLDLFFGSYARFLLGAILIVSCLLWAVQNELLDSVSPSLAFTGPVTEATGLSPVVPLRIPLIGQLIYSFDSLVAGAVLLLSAIVPRWRMSVFVIPAAAIAMLGTLLGIPDVLPLGVAHLNTLTTGLAVAMLALGFVYRPRHV